jgi:endo-1,3-1,4-beta-glycanase ExoK
MSAPRKMIIPRRLFSLSLVPLGLSLAGEAGAVASAELYQNQTYTYGRFEARVSFAAGDGVISSFFLWKPGSEMPGTFWNELDFEKLGADCHLQTNPLYGAPVVDHSQAATLSARLCGEYHTYTFEWTPTYIAYLVDGVEVRRDEGETAEAFATNASGGMQIHFNIWPGDATFGGNFDAAILPVQQYIGWVQYSSFSDGVFTPAWREEFDGATLPSGWAVGNWASPKSLSTHQPANVAFTGGFGVLSLTADAATGFTGVPPLDPASGGGNDVDGGAGTSPGVGGAAPGPSAGAEGGTSGVAAGGASSSAPSPTGANGGASAGDGGASATPVSAPRRAPASGCSPAAAPAHTAGAAWLALCGLALVACRRRSRPIGTRRAPS